MIKILNKGEFQKIAINNSSDIDFNDFANLHKERYCKVIFFFSESYY